MAKIGRICGVCGNIGQVEKSSLQASTENQPEIWVCESCKMRRTEMAERRKPEKGPAKRFENSKVKFLPSEDVIYMGTTGTVTPCIKRTTISRAAPIKTAAPNASSSGSKETGHKERNLKGHLPYHRNPVAWKGSLEVHDLFGNIIVDLAAYLPLQVSTKLVGAIETLPAKLRMRMVPRFGALPKRFDTDFPKFKDIGVFLLPSDRRLKTINLLRQLDSKKHALKMKVNGSLELVVHSSQLLAENFQKIEGDFFLWGFFCNRKIRRDSKKKKYSSPNVSPGKTCSEFRTPIAQDERSDVFKSTDQVGEVIIGTSDVCGNNLLEKKAVVDNFDVPPGFTKLPVGQETSTMDRQPETSMPGKEIKSSYKEVAPGCSSFSDKNNKESGRKGWFSSTGLGILEATLEECENQEYSEHAPGLIDKDVCDTSASPGMPPQVESSLPIETSGQILNKHEKELLVPLPIGLEISPGFSRAEVEARKEKNISNQHLETPPGFAPLGGASLIKQEQDLFPIQVVPGISPSFSGSIEQRKEKNLSSQFKGRQISMNQVLNVHTVVPDHFMDKPLLENQGIIHQQLPDGTRTVAFTYPAIQATTSRSCDIQLTSPHATISKVSVNNSQSTMPNKPTQSYSEQSNRTSSMHATGEIQRLHSSLTTPDVKYKDVSFSQMVAQSRDEFNRLHVALYKEPTLTPAPSHFHVLNPSFLESSSRDGYYSSINKQAADITATREEELKRDYVRGSPVWSRERSRSKSPVPRRYNSQSRSPGPRRYSSRSRSPVLRRYSRQSRSPVPRRYSSRSRSPVPRRYSSRSRSPVPRRYSSRSRSPVPRRYSSRSRSPIRRRQRSRTRSPVRRQYRNRSKSPVSRWNRSRPKDTFRDYRGRRVYRGNRSWVRNRGGHAGNIYDPGQNSSQYKGWCSSRFRGDYASDHSSPSRSRGRDRSDSLSPSPPVDLSWN